MIFYLSSLLRSILLITNALAILSEKRVLLRIGLSNASPVSADEIKSSKNPLFIMLRFCFGGRSNAVREQICHLLASIRTLLRIPLIVVNCVAICFAVIFG